MSKDIDVLVYGATGFTGRVVLADSADNLLANDDIKRAYLGA